MQKKKKRGKKKTSYTIHLFFFPISYVFLSSLSNGSHSLTKTKKTTFHHHRPFLPTENRSKKGPTMATAATQQMDSRNQPHVLQDAPRDAPEQQMKQPAERDVAAKVAELVASTGLSEDIASVLASITPEDIENPTKSKIADIMQILSGALKAAQENNAMYLEAKKELESAKGAARSSEDMHRQEAAGYLKEMLDWSGAVTGKKDDQKIAELKTIASKLVERAGAQDLGDMKLLFSTMRQASVAADNAMSIAGMEQWAKERDDHRIRSAFSNIKGLWSDPPEKRFVRFDQDEDGSSAAKKRRLEARPTTPPRSSEKRAPQEKPPMGAYDITGLVASVLAKSAAASIHNEQGHSFQTRKG